MFNIDYDIINQKYPDMDITFEEDKLNCPNSVILKIFDEYHEYCYREILNKDYSDDVVWGIIKHGVDEVRSYLEQSEKCKDATDDAEQAKALKMMFEQIFD